MIDDIFKLSVFKVTNWVMSWKKSSKLSIFSRYIIKRFEIPSSHEKIQQHPSNISLSARTEHLKLLGQKVTHSV